MAHSVLTPLLSLPHTRVQTSFLLSLLLSPLLALARGHTTDILFRLHFGFFFFASILRANSYHRIQVLFLYFFSFLLPVVTLYSSPHKRHLFGLLVATERDQWILIIKLPIPPHWPPPPSSVWMLLKACKIFIRRELLMCTDLKQISQVRSFIRFFCVGQRGKILLSEMICAAVWQKVTLVQSGVVWSTCHIRRSIDGHNS